MPSPPPIPPATAPANTAATFDRARRLRGGAARLPREPRGGHLPVTASPAPNNLRYVLIDTNRFKRCRARSAMMPARTASSQRQIPFHVRSGSIASIWRCPDDFRFTPDSRHSSEGSARPKRANSSLRGPFGVNGYPRAQASVRLDG